MSKAVKWILGIVVGLVAFCALAVAGFFVFSRFNFGAVAIRRRAFLPFEGPRNLPMPPFQGTPSQRFVGYSPFGFFGGWLIIAAALGLFALAVVALVLILKRPNRPAMQSVASSGQIPPSQSTGPMQTTGFDQPAAAEAAPAPSAAGQNCPSCGRAIQADWSHCPYCGTALTGTS
jgi:hypothetical protein